MCQFCSLPPSAEAPSSRLIRWVSVYWLCCFFKKTNWLENFGKKMLKNWIGIWSFKQVLNNCVTCVVETDKNIRAILLQLPDILPSGSFRSAAFTACSCVRKMQCRKLENFLSLRKGNCLRQLHAVNTARLNEPYGWPKGCDFNELHVNIIYLIGIKHLKAATNIGT